jgi:hypothetical protein
VERQLFAFADILSYDLCRMLAAFDGLSKAAFEVEVLRSVEEAKNWLVA